MSIFELITELCEKHIDKRKCVYESINIPTITKKLRAKAFEILLKKKHLLECYNELEGNVDPICHLLAWQCTLKHELNLPEQAAALGIFINDLKTNENLDNPVVQNVILFLLHLKGSKSLQEENNFRYNILDKVNLRHKAYTESTALPYDLYTQNKFHFPDNFTAKDPKALTIFSLNSFKSSPHLNLSLSKKSSKKYDTVLKYSNYKFGSIFEENKTEKDEIKVEFIPDEGYESPVRDGYHGDIWELVSKLPVNEHRTWESLDNIDPEKELPFACESGGKILHLFQKILNANILNCISDENVVEERILSTEKFIKAVKYMLVGMTSDIFSTNEEGLFYLKENICVEDISNMALKSYCNDLLFCGSCYRSLNNLCVPNSYKSNEDNGFVFKELCESIKRYLAFYRVAALSFPDTSDLLTAHLHMRELHQQIGALAKICCVPPAVNNSQQRLRGAQLLDYIYREITEAIDSNVQLVLYAAFYPCCQIYFSRFLQRWLFEGVLIDPYEEFIVKSETNYIKSRVRAYWNKGFSLRHDSIPEFLTDLKMDILQCGKTMNLLKQCNPDAALYTHIMSRSLPLISCCLTSDQNRRLKQEIDCYYVEMSAACGPRISLYHRIRDRYGNEENAALLNLVEKKRALAFREMELRKQLKAEEKAKRKRKIFEEMQEQMRISAEQKKMAKEENLKEELLIAEQAAQIEELRSKLVKEESKMIIKYYNNLIEAVDKRRNSIELRKQKLLESSIDLSSECSTESSTIKNENSTSGSINLPIESSSASVTLKNEDNNSETKISESDSDQTLIAEKDKINKNVEGASEINTVNQLEETISSDLKKTDLKSNDTQNLDLKNANVDLASVELNNQKNENFLQAQKNRAKVLNLEFDQKINEQKSTGTRKRNIENSNLTEAQRNRLKVLSSEFDIYYQPKNNNEVATTSETNKRSIILTNEETFNNNANIIIPKVTSNLASPGHEDVMNITHRKKILKLPKPNELITIYEKQVSQNESTPMSIDSTPNTEYSTGELFTPSSAKLSLNTDICLDTPSMTESAILTANSCLTDDGFRFPEPKKSIYENTKLLFANKRSFSITEKIPKTIQPMRVSKKDVDEINGNLKNLLYHSVYIPLEAQMKLVNSEIIKYFVNEQNFLSHLHSLRCYYFLFDGEFSRHITDSLFTKLYDCKSPTELLSCRSLQLIIDGALHASSKIQENGDRLSFIVKNIPNNFDLSSIEVLDCLSLSYKINWPLNIILPYDAIDKYATVFKYLLKLHHISWVLQKVSQELKNTQKEIGIDETLLFNSPQYHKIQLYRHIMYHFIQTLQNYTVAEVLQTSWDELETNLKNVTTIDQLYGAHVIYIKTIIFRCLLNRKCGSVMKIIHEIFTIILKFYNYLRSRSWNLRENDIYYTHPNFKKMEQKFSVFEDFTVYIFKVGNKMARVGYQPHLIQMLDMLNVNNYYTNRVQKHYGRV